MSQKYQQSTSSSRYKAEDITLNVDDLLDESDEDDDNDLSDNDEELLKFK